MTPLNNTQTVAKERYNESQIRTRNPIEQCYSVWKRFFPILATGIYINLETAKSVIVLQLQLQYYITANNLSDKTITVNYKLEQDVELINHILVGKVNNTPNTRQQIIQRSHVNYFGNL